MYTGSMSLDGVFLARAVCVNKKELKHLVFEKGLNVLMNKTVAEIYSLIDPGVQTLRWVCLFCCFTSQSTAMVMVGRSVQLTTLFPHFACNWQQPFLNDSAEGRRMTLEIISLSISSKVWDRAGIKLGILGYAVRHASVARHVTDWCMSDCISRWEHFSSTVTFSCKRWLLSTDDNLCKQFGSRSGRHRERSGSVVECLTRDRRPQVRVLTSVTALWSLSKTHLS